jgi:hypothetical protein
MLSSEIEMAVTPLGGLKAVILLKFITIAGGIPGLGMPAGLAYVSMR